MERRAFAGEGAPARYFRWRVVLDVAGGLGSGVHRCVALRRRMLRSCGLRRLDGRALLYVGISPKAPPLNGKPPSRSTLRKRIWTHYFGNAAGSTFRRTLGCLLNTELSIQLRRVGSGGRYTFTNPGEQRLDQWLRRRAFVTWVETDAPWQLERRLLSSGLSLPINIDGVGNPHVVAQDQLSAP